jgi:hypothetical protein
MSLLSNSVLKKYNYVESLLDIDTEVLRFGFALF